MSSSGLIYAVIVGAWAAYLVPMWLRRQDELNDSRPTERFSTAIRLLSGRAAMERRHAKEREAREGTPGPTADDDAAGDPDAAAEEAAARDSGDPAPVPSGAGRPAPAVDPAAPTEVQQHSRAAATSERGKRAKVLARRRRTTTVLFLAFTFGAVIAGVGGVRFLWAPGIPAVLLSGYIVYLRAQERRRFAVRLDRGGAEAAARRLHERRRPERKAPAAADPAPPDRGTPGHGTPAEDRRALVEQTDHAEWIDQQRERGRDPQGDGWDPVPVPLPTYVNAPVAARTASGVDLDASDIWSSARSTASDPATGRNRVDPQPQPQLRSGGPPEAVPDAVAPTPHAGRRGRRRAPTPLFDQYAEQERRRAANE